MPSNASEAPASEVAASEVAASEVAAPEVAAPGAPAPGAPAPGAPAPGAPAPGAPAPGAAAQTAPSATGRPSLASTASNALKIVIVGGFGVGKTTMVGSVSEMRPLSTEEVMTQASAGVDDLSAVRDKRTTTAAFDFGRITVDATRVLYLFGAPGQKRFWFLWEQLFTGSLGAVVLVDTARVEESWYAIDRLEHHHTPFIVAVNRFAPGPNLDDVRVALDLSDDVPLLECDARSRESSRDVLIALVHHLARYRPPVSAPERSS